MNIIKVYNNNVVLAKNDQDEELIVMGKGAWFSEKMGDAIAPLLIEKTFVL